MTWRREDSPIAAAIHGAVEGILPEPYMYALLAPHDRLQRLARLMITDESGWPAVDVDIDLICATDWMVERVKREVVYAIWQIEQKRIGPLASPLQAFLRAARRAFRFGRGAG